MPSRRERKPAAVRIIDRQIIRELVPLTLIALGVTTGVFFLDKLMGLASLVLQNRLGPGASWRLLCYTLPTVSGLTLPIGFLMGCTLTLHRMSADSELVVLHAAGVSVYRLLVPFFLAAAAAYGLSIVALMYVSPWGHQGLRQLVFDIAPRPRLLPSRAADVQRRLQGADVLRRGRGPRNAALRGHFRLRRSLATRPRHYRRAGRAPRPPRRVAGHSAPRQRHHPSLRAGGRQVPPGAVRAVRRRAGSGYPARAPLDRVRRRARDVPPPGARRNRAP